jgi:ATP synthase protein I
MNSEKSIHRQVVNLTAGLLVILLVYWFVTPYQRLIAGLFLGILISLLLFLHLSYRLQLVTERVLATGSPKIPGLGMVFRISLVFLGMVLTAVFPSMLDYRTVVLGLPVCYILSYFILLLSRDLQNK